MQIGRKILIAVDLDGTLLNDKKEISNYTKRVFFMLAKKGTIMFIVKYKCRKLQTKNVGCCNYIL